MNLQCSKKKNKWVSSSWRGKNGIVNCVKEEVISDKQQSPKDDRKGVSTHFDEIMKRVQKSLLWKSVRLDPPESINIDNIRSIIVDNEEILGSEGVSLLHEAVQRPHDEKDSFMMCRRLLEEAGADPNLPDHMHQTPLFYACTKDNRYVVDLLLQSYIWHRASGNRIPNDGIRFEKK